MTAIKNTGKIKITDEQMDEVFSRVGNQAKNVQRITILICAIVMEQVDEIRISE